MNNAPYKQEDWEDWSAYRNFIEQGAERMLQPAPHYPYSPRDNAKEDFLAEIQAENVRASNERIDHHE